MAVSEGDSLVIINSSNRNKRIAVFILVAVIALAPQFPIAADIDKSIQSGEPELILTFEPLPNFNIREMRKRPASRTDIDHKKKTLALEPAALSKIEMRWNDEIDAPHHLFSLSAPLTSPSNDSAVTIAKRFVRDNSALFALSQRELESSRISAHSADERDGLTRLALEQRVNNLRV